MKSIFILSSIVWFDWSQFFRLQPLHAQRFSFYSSIYRHKCKFNQIKMRRQRVCAQTAKWNTRKTCGFRFIHVCAVCVCIRHGIVKVERKPCLMATLACMQRHVFHPNKFSTMKTTNSVPVYVNYLESWEASQLPHRLPSFFLCIFIRLQHFYGFPCVTISLSYAARIRKNCGCAIIYFKCFASCTISHSYHHSQSQRAHTHTQKSLVSPEESHKFTRRSISIRLCLPKHVTLNAYT